MTHSVLAVQVTGVAPLVMHNGQMADPLNPIAMELERYTGRRKKTRSDFERIADLEYIGGLWLDEGRPCVPAAAFEAAILQSASRSRLKTRYRGTVMVKGNPVLRYDGPDTIDGLKADPGFRLRVAVVVAGRRVMRTRPLFASWSASLEIAFLPSYVNRADLLDVLTAAGDTVGVGDHRPVYGRFSVAVSDATPIPEPLASHG